KTKATQHSVKELRAIGIQPDVLLCRTDRYLPPGIKSKIALFCDVEEEAVITAKDVETIYEVPLNFHREGLDEIIVKLLGLAPRRSSRASTASSCPAASATGESRARSRRSATRASSACRTSGSAWACSARSSNTPATSAVCAARAPRSSTRRRRIW